MKPYLFVHEKNHKKTPVLRHKQMNIEVIYLYFNRTKRYALKFRDVDDDDGTLIDFTFNIKGIIVVINQLHLIFDAL